MHIINDIKHRLSNLNLSGSSKLVRRSVAGLVALLLALIIFWAGTAVGYRKAMFSYRWHSHYAEQFAGDRSPLALFHDGDADNTPNPHGAFGMIASVQLPLIVIKGPAEAEKTIVVTSETVVRDEHDPAASTTLAAGQGVVVIGRPDDQGRVVASFIRIIPPPPFFDDGASPSSAAPSAASSSAAAPTR